jgi:hypothetical protein
MIVEIAAGREEEEVGNVFIVFDLLWFESEAQGGGGGREGGRGR